MRIISDFPVYKVGGIGVTSIERVDEGYELRFIPFRLIRDAARSDSFWGTIFKKSWSHVYEPQDMFFHKIVSSYRDEKDYPFENLSKEELTGMADSFFRKSA